MKSPRPRFLIALALTIGLILFYQFGRPIWMPIKLKLQGKNTVSDILTQLEPSMQKRFPDLSSLTDGSPIAILAFKEERQLEVWKQDGSGWKHICDYGFTGYSGKLGPKLKEGDSQIPEGIYTVEYLNPNSSFHLSIKVDYPNDFDRAKADEEDRTQLGDDIFIHGSNASIGCIPIGNKNIEELFYLVAKNGYPNTKIIIAPYDMRGQSKPLEIPSVTWEDELYRAIAERLEDFPKPKNQ